jgi:mediator of RNA polymerase II transcription subunit 6
MAATRALNKFYEAAASLQFYTPDRGYSYHPPISKSKAIASLESTRTSRANSPIPDAVSQTTHTLQSGAKEAQQGNDDRAIATSFSLALQWGSEYMDENPLIGEPGALKLSSTSRHVKDQQDRTQAEAAKAVQQEKEKESESARASVAPTPGPLKTTDLKKGSLSSKGKSPVSATSDAGTKKRRKSKAPGTPGVSSPS